MYKGFNTGKLQVAIGVRVDGEAQNDAAEARQSRNGGGVRVIDIDEIHETITEPLSLLRRIRVSSDHRHRVAATRPWYRIRVPIIHKLRARRYQRSHRRTIRRVFHCG